LFSGQVWDTYQIRRITQIFKNKLNTWRQQTLLDTCHAPKMILEYIHYLFQQVKKEKTKYGWFLLWLGLDLRVASC
jgi:hypothetical protein